MLWRMSADLHDQRIGDMGIFFSVILSEAKACPERSRRDLMPAASGDEILRFAQDDNGKHSQPATSVLATKVSLQRSAIAKMGSGNCGNRFPQFPQLRQPGHRHQTAMDGTMAGRNQGHD